MSCKGHCECGKKAAERSSADVERCPCGKPMDECCKNKDVRGTVKAGEVCAEDDQH